MANKVEKDSDEVKRKLLKPDPSEDDAIAVLKASYAKTADAKIEVVKKLESYDDVNFWVRIEGTDFLFKVHNGVESQEWIDSGDRSAIHLQNSVMEHLGSLGISTSRPQPTANGAAATVALHDLQVVSKEHSPCKLATRLLQWVPGRTMASVPFLPVESLADAGRFLGRLHAELAKLNDRKDLTAADRFHQWDGKNTNKLLDFIDCIQDERRQGMVKNIIETFDEQIIKSGVSDQFRKGLIHADYNDANILLDDDLCVSGVIDFGDSVRSWQVLDVSVAMAYAMLTVYGKQNRSISAAAAFLRGYHATCPLPQAEREYLVLLIACRLSCSVTLGAYSYQQNPGNEYLLLHALPAWNALDLIWGTDADRRNEMKTMLDGVFELACKEGIDSGAQVIDCSDLAFPDPEVADPFATMRS